MAMAEAPGARAEIVEVGPRDGLQNESVHFDTARKRDFILRLLDSGLRRMEVASFVNPKRVPQMADAEALLESLPQDRGARYVGLVLNPRGVERALRTAVHELNFVIVASDTFNRKNQGVSTGDSLAAWFEIARLAQEAKVPCGLTLAASFGCPYEGEVPLSQLVELAQRAAAAGPAEIALADTIGVAVPAEVTRRVKAVRGAVGNTPLRCHFHNTRNTGLANAWAAWQAGVRVLDASAGGIGGCPFAPSATGNIPTEDLAYLLSRSGVEIGVDLPRLLETTHWLEAQLQRPVPGLLGRAGPFPPTPLAA